MQTLLLEIVELGCRVFRENLTGIYLHGSLAMECFTFEKSDVDFLIVLKEHASDDEKYQLMDGLTALYPKAPGKGLEMSIVLERYCRNFVYPTPYELHLSETTMDRYRKRPDEYLNLYQGVDPDLAAHFVITKKRGRTLFGVPISEVFGLVPKAAYFDSIYKDIEDAGEAVETQPVYVILNLCRVAAFCEEEQILSKKEGGEWGLRHGNPCDHALIRGALEAYCSGGTYRPDPVMEKAFCEAMLCRIRALAYKSEGMPGAL